ncbi:MAG: hypothetical protein QXF45_04750 [Candidatus Caldarchaeum sp.]
MKRNLIYLVLLLTIVWLMFLAASSIVGIVILPVLEGSDRNVFLSMARTIVGIGVFVVWVVFWHKIADFWLYKVLLRRE